MKSLFPYVVLIALFVISSKLVDRQQEYTRALEESAAVDNAPFLSNLVDEKSADNTGDRSINSDKRISETGPITRFGAQARHGKSDRRTAKQH